MGRNGKRNRGATARRKERVEVQLPRFNRDGTITVQASGRSVVVEAGIPTESAIVALRGSGKRWHGEVVTVLSPAEERVTPRCPVVEECGGCEWQHISHEGQLKHKAAIVRRLLSAHRLPTHIDEIVPMPGPWAYRVRAQIALGAVAGFRALRSKQIVRLLGCPVVDPLISWLLDQLNRLLSLNEIPDFDGKLILHAQVVGAPASRNLQLLLEGTDGFRIETAEQIRDVASMLSTLERVESVCWSDADGNIQAFSGETVSELELGGLSYIVPSGSFFQSNFRLLPKLLDRLQQLAELDGTQRVMDIYGGIGLLGLSLVDRAQSVTIIEIDRLAAEAGQRTAQLRGLNNVEFIASSAEDAIDSLSMVDRVIVDPPRTGLDQIVINALIERTPEMIIYVSCNPATFARDADKLARSGYTVEHFSLWDFYPQTVHVECVAKFVQRRPVRVA